MKKIQAYFCYVRCPFSRVEGHDAVFFKGHRGDFFQVFFLAFHAFKEHHRRKHGSCRTARRAAHSAAQKKIRGSGSRLAYLNLKKDN